MKRWMWGLVVLAGLAAAVRLLARFPWGDTGAALLGAHLPLLAAAIGVNLVSPVAKGWAWHLLLQRVAPHRWRTAQEATIVGTAVNSVSVGVTGDAARVALLVRKEGVPVRAATLAVAWSRVVEAIGLALFLALAPLVLHLPPALRGVQWGAAGAILTVFVLARLRGWARLIVRLPRSFRGPAVELARMGLGPRLVAPVALACLNWLAQWATYYLALRATGLDVSGAAAFTALLAANLGSLGRLTPGGVGLMQAAIVGALLPFGIAAERAVAGGLVLQAIQVLPVLGLAGALVGWSGIRASLLGEKEIEEAA